MAHMKTIICSIITKIQKYSRSSMYNSWKPIMNGFLVGTFCFIRFFFSMAYIKPADAHMLILISVLFFGLFENTFCVFTNYLKPLANKLNQLESYFLVRGPCEQFLFKMDNIGVSLSPWKRNIFPKCAWEIHAIKFWNSQFHPWKMCSHHRDLMNKPKLMQFG